METATTCFGMASAPSLLVSQVRTVRALSIVSAVVNVLDTTTTSVSSCSSPAHIMPVVSHTIASTLSGSIKLLEIREVELIEATYSESQSSSDPHRLPTLPSLSDKTALHSQESWNRNNFKPFSFQW